MAGDFDFIINLVAGLFLAVAQSIYLIQVVRKKITPSLFTWLGWAILVAVSLLSQIVEFGWTWTLTGHLFCAFGCFAIFVAAFSSGNFQLIRKDWIYLFMGMACVVLYLVFTDPWSTTIFAITADAILGIPTLIKGYKNPKTEKTIGWNIALVCWALTLVTCLDKNVIFCLFPLYCFLFNVIMSVLTSSKRRQAVNISYS